MAYPTTSTPIDRAEPSIIFIADSIVSQLRSTIFFSAISLIWSRVILPTKAPARRLGAGGRLLADLQADRLLDEEGDRRLPHLEGEGAVLIGGDDDRDRRALLDLRGARVERLAELHDVEAALTERGTDRGRRIGRARRHLQFDIAGDFLRHEAAPKTTGPFRERSRTASPGCSSWCERGPGWRPDVLPRGEARRLAGLRGRRNFGSMSGREGCTTMTVAKARREPQLVRYEDDVLLWSQEQARFLREGRFAELDIEHLADEIEDVGKSEKRELASRMSGPARASHEMARTAATPLPLVGSDDPGSAAAHRVVAEETPSLQSKALAIPIGAKASGWTPGPTPARRCGRKLESGEISDSAVWSMASGLAIRTSGRNSYFSSFPLHLRAGHAASRGGGSWRVAGGKSVLKLVVEPRVLLALLLGSFGAFLFWARSSDRWPCLPPCGAPAAARKTEPAARRKFR